MQVIHVVLHSSSSAMHWIMRMACQWLKLYSSAAGNPSSHPPKACLSKSKTKDHKASTPVTLTKRLPDPRGGVYSASELITVPISIYPSSGIHNRSDLSASCAILASAQRVGHRKGPRASVDAAQCIVNLHDSEAMVLG